MICVKGCKSKLRGKLVVLLAEEVSDEVELAAFIGGSEQDYRKCTGNC